jgi:proteic killer suppression protein
MDLEFGDEALRRLYSDAGFGMGLPLSVVKSFRRKVYFISEATDERDLRAWKALHFEKLKGDREHQCSIRLNEKYRLVFEIFGGGQDKRLRIVGVEDYH